MRPLLAPFQGRIRLPAAIKLGTDGSIYVAKKRGEANFPFTTRIGQGEGPPSFVIKLDPTGSHIQFATQISAGTFVFDVFAIALGSDGSIVVAGRVSGPGAPVAPG